MITALFIAVCHTSTFPPNTKEKH